MDAAHAFHRFINAQRYRLFKPVTGQQKSMKTDKRNRQIAGGVVSNSVNQTKVRYRPSSPQPNAPTKQNCTMEQNDFESDTMIGNRSQVVDRSENRTIEEPSSRPRFFNGTIVHTKCDASTRSAPEPISQTRFDNTSMNSTDTKSNKSFQVKRPLIVVHRDQKWEYDTPEVTVCAEPVQETRFQCTGQPLATSSPNGSDTDLVTELRDELQKLQRKFAYQSEEISTLHCLVQKLHRKCKELADKQSQTCHNRAPSEPLEDLAARLQCQAKEVSNLNRLVRTLQLECREMASSQTHRQCGHCNSREEQLPCNTSSQCVFCRDKELPVLTDDLDVHLCRLSGMRNFSDLLLTVLLRADNIYHINVRELKTNKVVGCLLANESAIEEGIKSKLFEKVLTFVVVDQRSTLKPRPYPFGITFEFLNEDGPSPCENTAKCTDKRKRSCNIGRIETCEQSCRPEPSHRSSCSTSWLPSTSKLREWISLPSAALFATSNSKSKGYKRNKRKYEEECRKCHKPRNVPDNME